MTNTHKTYSGDTEKMDLPRIDVESQTDFAEGAELEQEAAFVPVQGVSSKTRSAEKMKQRRIIRNVIIGIVAFILVIYGAGFAFFSSHFYPSTTMGDSDISFMSKKEVVPEINATVGAYELHVTGVGFDLSMTPKDVAISADAERIVDEALKAHKAYAWPYKIMQGSHNVSQRLELAFDEREIRGYVQAKVEDFNKEATRPADAKPVYDAEKKEFVPEKEKPGTMLSADAVADKVVKALEDVSTSVTLEEADLVKADVLSDDPRLADAIHTANGYLQVGLSIKLNGEEVAMVDADTVAPWIVFDKEFKATLDDKKMAEWARDLGKKYDTVYKERKYTRPDGKEITVNPGTYGWEIDESTILPEVKDAIEKHTVGEYEVPCVRTGNGVNVKLGYDWAAFVDVDLTEQHARYYDGAGNLVWESDVVTGTYGGSDATPTGVYMVNNKEQNVTLKGPMVTDPDDPKKKKKKPKWESPVDYWIPFIGNGYGLHDASWQSAFGGNRYKEGFGSHGCVNLPLDKVQELYGLVNIGDPVIVHW